MKDIKELLNIEKILKPIIDKNTDNNLNVQNTLVMKATSTDGMSTDSATATERAQEVPILQMYAKTSQGITGKRDSDTTKTETKFYPLVSSNAVIVDSQAYIFILNKCKNILSLYGEKVGISKDIINSYLSKYEKAISSESSADTSNIHDIFYPIDNTLELIKELYSTVSAKSSSSSNIYEIRTNHSLLKEQWVKSSSSNLLEYYTYNLNITYSLTNIIQNFGENSQLKLDFIISPYEECTSDYNKTYTSATLTTADIQSNNIENMLLFSEYGITKIDEDIKNKTITIMSKKQPDKDILICVTAKAEK